MVVVVFVSIIDKKAHVKNVVVVVFVNIIVFVNQTTNSLTIGEIPHFAATPHILYFHKLNNSEISLKVCLSLKNCKHHYKYVMYKSPKIMENKDKLLTSIRQIKE